MKLVLWKKKDIILGEQAVSEITVIECKKMFSIKIFHFKPTDGKQDRFHTHAFKAVSVLLSGNYVEEVIIDGHITPLQRNRKRFLYIPDNQYHRITRSSGCRTLLITGPWGSEFSELRKEGENWVETVCGEHRVDLREGKTVKITGE